MTIYDIDFTKEFLLYDFDKLLVEKNNPLINSRKYYISYKQNYIKQTKANLQQFKNIKNEFDKLIKTEFQKPSDTSYLYCYIDNNRKTELQNELKVLIQKQRKNVKILIEHINILNENMNKLSSEISYGTGIKNMIFKMFDNKKKSRSSKTKYKRTITK